MQRILIYGGSFDPIHNGHINTALSVQNQFHFDKIIFVPCKIPVLKAQTEASPEQRVAMLELAIESYSNFFLDCREINRDSPSYMIDTLISFHKELGNTYTLTLLIGMDAYLQFTQWHHWQDILKLSHLLVIHRAGIHNNLHSGISHKKISYFNAGEYFISSTQIRQLIKEGKEIKPFLPNKVADYIQRHGLYLDKLN